MDGGGRNSKQMKHIESELPKVLIKVLFCALFWGKELFWALLIVPELFRALFKALYFALLCSHSDNGLSYIRSGSDSNFFRFSLSPFLSELAMRQ